MRTLLSTFVLAALVAPATASAASTAGTAATSECAYWRSETKPPPYIKVLLRDGRTVWVDFKRYTARVTSSEWGSVAPELRKAGALAVRQYGWRHVSRWRGQSWNGKCFHVYSWNRDQIYKHDKVPTAQAWAATDWAWGRTLRNRNGVLVFTSYRAGYYKRCAADAGKRLYARSGERCAWMGWSAERILEKYYEDHGATLR